MWKVQVKEMCLKEIDAKNARDNLAIALERIEELENELSEKTRLVNELLLSKDEILNDKYKYIVDSDAARDLCIYCNNKLSNVSSSSLTSTRDDISANLDCLQAKIQSFFEYVNIFSFICFVFQKCNFLKSF